MTKSPGSTITIPFDEYEALKLTELKLECLDEGGVDNWDWYGSAMKCYSNWRSGVEIDAELRRMSQDQDEQL